jgi:apolipoprotein N-acyltransferase
MDFATERPATLRRTLAALACSAILFFFGTGLAPIAALTWLAPLPVLLLAPRVSGMVAALVAFVAYFLGTTNSWHFYSHSHDIPLTTGLIMSALFALTLTLAVVVFRGLARRGRALLAALAAPAIWVSVLFLFTLLAPYGMVGTLATAQGDVPIVLQTAAVAGAWGVDFLILLASSAIAALTAPGVATAARVRTAAVAAVVLGVALSASALRLSGDEGTGRTQRVALVVNNHSPWGVNVGTQAGHDLVADYAQQISALPDGVQTAVLPEGAFSVDDASYPALVQPLAAVAKSRSLDVLVGFTHVKGTARHQNALVLPADGGTPLTYLKHHDMVSPPGHDLVYVPDPEIRIGVEICRDLAYADPSRDYARAGTTLVAIPASTEDDNGWQMSRTGLLRGVENGFAIAWSSRRGTLTIADGYGRVLSDASSGGPTPFHSTVLDVPAGPGATPYTHLGDMFAWLCVALALAGAIATFPARPRKRHDPADNEQVSPASAGGQVRSA